ncbi:Asp23/Gls24 family envelope stress response protein [Microbacterium sp. lyk4-40-TSB-66]|uniref:Asp23/Gls24 family envelope stress response protein n=1 Tax=Microbacterium sp. lyk4-40-TSB-66 TaxID=3040294 RepID=UPI0025515A4F|nr:Asp23/Gls24 family envelope stress response protein [Microbacterium sp. lyk4-40-TSB-66]
MTNDSISTPTATQPDPADLARSVADAVARVEGVHALGTLVERASDSVRQRVGLAGGVAGVTVDRGRDGRVTSAVSIIVDYPHKLHDVTDAVRTATRDALGGLGSGRVDVDVTVTGVWGPFDTDPVVEAEESLDDAADAVAAATDTVTRDADRTDVDERGDAGVGTRADHRRRSESVAATSAASDRDDAQDAVADALADVADTVAHAAEELRDRPDSPRR